MRRAARREESIIENASRVDVESEVEVFGVWVEGEAGGETEGDAAEGEEGGETEGDAAAAAATAATETGRPCGRVKGGCYSARTEHTHKKHTSGVGSGRSTVVIRADLTTAGSDSLFDTAAAAVVSLAYMVTE
jgi:hypothetical protein